MYKVYIQTKDGIVTAINSDAFLPDTEGWTQIDEGDGDKYHHAQGNYFPQPIMTDEGVPRYKLVDGKAVERTAEEIQADIDAIPPPPPDPVRVVFQTLARTDVLTEQQALESQQMFDLWTDRIGTTATIGEYLRHDDGLFRVKQAHTAQSDWPPDTAQSLFSRINAPGEIPAWVQGIYDEGVLVTHGGKTWISMVDNNSWEPGAAGIGDTIWKEVVE